ncbi:helix-turn-helix domain-containing protein [Enterobacter hormaechei]
MTATTAASKPFTSIPHDLADIEQISGKAFTMNMVYTYSLIKSFQDNGQTAYFSQELLARRLGASTRSVIRLLAEMVEMGLINSTGRVGGKTCHYTVNPITPAMLGTAEPEAPQEQPQRATAGREEVQESNHTAEPVEAPEAPITLMTVYSEKVETVEQADPQPGEVVPVVVPFPRGEIKEPSRDWDLDPAF